MSGEPEKADNCSFHCDDHNVGAAALIKNRALERMSRMTTQSHLFNRLNLRSAITQSYLPIFLCAVLLISAGCGIPGRRGAQPGNSLPAGYNWNNGASFWRHTADSANQSNQPPKQADSQETEAEAAPLELEGPEPDEELNSNTSSRKNRSRSAPLVDSDSFVKPASYAKPIQDDQPEDEMDKRIRAIEDDINQDNIPKKDDVDNRIREIEDDIKDQPDDKSTASDDVAPQQQNLGEENVDISVSIGVDGNSAQLPHNAFYNDPFLLALIEETMSGNQELKILAEEIRIACNEAYARSGEYRPFVSLKTGVGYDKVGEHTRLGAVENQLEVSPDRAFPEPLGDFLVAADLSWEVDIWNRLRNSQRAAAMQYLGTQEGRNYIVTRMVSEVAENYYELLALDSRLETLERTIEIQKSSLQVCRGQKKAGRATELSVQRFLGEVEKNRSEVSLIQQEIVEAENRINFLAGRFPQPVERISTNFVELNLGILSSGVPSELLQNRADIREAERNVEAAGLNLEVARARFYPNLSLRAGLGWNAFRTGYLFRTPESLIYSLAGDLVGPLINKRAIQADYRTANAEQLKAIYNYQKTVLEAHIEVVNHMTKVENFRRSVDLKMKQLDALEASVEAANRLFQNARVEYVEVLLAQREMMEAKMSMIETKREQLEAVVNAYQALGGGQF